MKSFRDGNHLTGWLCIFAILMLGLAAWGGFRNYSPIPFWDMWNGVYAFIFGLQDGDYSSWWGQHNEHRIVLARIFFWLDYEFFGLKAVSLFVLNYVFAALSAILFACFVSAIAMERAKPRNSALMLSLFVFGWLFLWTQQENFTWGFQSQFFLVQLIPLGVFYCLAAASAEHSGKYFFGACILGVLSAGTMANGVVALPLAFLMTCLLPFSWGKRLIFLALAVIIPVCYFHGYVQPPGHGSLTKTLAADPVGVLRYSLIYLGSPFYVIAKKSGSALLIAEVFGGILVLGSVAVAVLWCAGRRKSPYVAGLLFFILFIGGTAVGTAGGRLIFGLAQAASERYTTPAVMAWAALLIACYAYVNGFTSRSPRFLGALVIVVLLALVLYQSRSVRLNHQVMFNREIGALAATLGVDDPLYVRQLFSDSGYVLSLTDRALRRHIGFVNYFPFAGVADGVGGKVGTFPENTCQGVVDELELLPGKGEFLRMTGSALNTRLQTVPRKFSVIDESNVVIGYVLTGNPRKDLGRSHGSFARRAGFKGYVKGFAQGRQVRLVASDGSCSITLDLPRLFFERMDGVDRQAYTIQTEALVSSRNFNGTSNVPAESAPEATIYSSYVKGDSDLGHIKLRVRNGDVLMYRTGPVSSRQLLKSEIGTASLPQSTDWSMLRFMGFPDDAMHDVTLEDAGDAWGEWAAVALRNQ
ncbi:hypothetical protein [Diaphorobacter ruginosibacter]|uniref:hypothetical protein n=1 Tax=Diaphorobacter ruginosibacter TaxID=1715720 RepID=UPI00334286C0